MIRKFLIRLVAVGLMIGGVTQFVAYLLLLTNHPSLYLSNCIEAIVSVGLFCAGSSLFFLGDLGRKLTLAMIAINALWNLLLLVLVLIYPQTYTPFSFQLFGQIIYQTQNHYLIALILVLWEVIILGIGSLLLQKESRDTFAGRKSGDFRLPETK